MLTHAIVLIVVASVATACTFSANDGSFYDLSALQLNDASYNFTDSDGIEYLLNICGAATGCADAKAAVCQKFPTGDEVCGSVEKMTISESGSFMSVTCI